MFKTILAFIKAHTIATAITTTVVVSTVVATPIIVNQVQKQPEQEVSQVQENIIDNSVVENTTIEENTETPEENNVEENTTVPEKEQKVETPKEENKQEQNKNQGTTKPTTPTSNTNTTKPTTNNNKTETPSQPSTPTQPTQKKIVSFNDGALTIYDETNQLVTGGISPCYSNIPKSQWLSQVYPADKKSLQTSLEYAIQIDRNSGIYNKDYCQKKITEYTKEINRTQSALEYFKLHENEIQVDENNNWKYKGYTYNNYIPDFERDIAIAERNKKQWENILKTAPQYRTRRTRKEK